MKYKKHVFICTNEKEKGKFCGQDTGMKMVKRMQELLKENGLNTEIRAQRSGCLDVCKDGPAMVVYPEGVFYGGVTPEDIEEIVEQHLKNDKPVERLKLNF